MTRLLAHPVLAAPLLLLALCAGASAAGPTVADPAAAGVQTASGGVAETILFYVFGGLTLLSALGVALSRSVVRMAVWLFGALGGVAVLYFLLAANFLGAIQLIVYVGGTLVLLIFGVMLTAKSPRARFDTKPSQIWAAWAVCVLLLVALMTVIGRAEWPAERLEAGGLPVAALGQELLTTYLVPFEVASVLLLVVMIGAAYLARQER